MRLHDKLGRLLQSGAIEGEGGGKVAQPPPRPSRGRGLALLLGLAGAMLGDAALAAVQDDVEAMHTLSDDGSILWQPPNSSEMIVDEAQWGSPVAPFVFQGGVLHVGGSFRTRREFRVDGPAVINTHDEAVLHISGPVGSQGGSSQGLVKLGAGTLRLSGHNTYDGNTLLLQGGLDVLHSHALGAPYRGVNVNTGTRLRYAPGIVVDNSLQLQETAIAPYVPAGSYVDITPAQYADSVQWIVDEGQAVQAGALAGTAPIVKQGAGTLRLTGAAMAYDGLFTVNQGALAVDDVFWGPVRVNDGARLQGVGQVGDTAVMAGGTLAPGNGVGMLMVHGDLDFKPGSRFLVDVAASGAGDSVRVSGKARLDGQVMALAQAGDWRADTRYTLLRADGGFDNTRFASVDTNLAFLSPSLDYDATQVYLTLRRNAVDFDDVADTPDDPVADVLDDPAELPDLRDKVLELTEDQARQAFRQLSGDWTGSVYSSMQDDTRFLREAVWANAAGRPGVWAQGFYSAGRRSASGGVPGDARDLGGMVLGVNRPVGGRALAGMFFGIQRSGLRRDESMADATIDGAHAGLGLSGQWRGMSLALGAAYTWHVVDSSRKVAVGRLRDALSSGYRAGSAQVFGQASWPVALSPNGSKAGGAHAGPAMVVEPFARMAWVRTHTPGFTEKGGSAALQVLPDDRSVVFSTLGLRLTRDVDTAWGAVRARAGLAWRHAQGDVQATVRQRFRDGASGTVFQSEGLPLPRDAWQWRLGLRTRLAKAVDLGLAYAGQAASGSRDHGVKLNLSWAF